MPRNGSGTFNRVHDWSEDEDNNLDIEADRMDEDTDDIADGISQSLSKDGQTNPTANLPMANFIHTGVGNATARNNYPAVGQIQDQSFNWCGTAGGTANALTLTPSPAITAYATGQSFAFKAGASPNSAATTIAISGLATIAVQFDGAACIGGEIRASKWYRITLDSTSTCQLECLSDNLPFIDSTPIVRGSADNTKQLRFEVDGFTTGTTRVLTPPNFDGTIATLAGTEALTNKTINGITPVTANQKDTSAAGTVYTLTATSAAIDFGTTDPIITLNSPGTYLLMAVARVEYTGATFAASRLLTLQINRTNNTPGLIGGDARHFFNTPIITTQTYTAGLFTWYTLYSTSNSDDVLQLFGDISVLPSAGSIQVANARITAIRLQQ